VTIPMAYTASENRRGRLVAGLRALADFLENRPEAPAPRWADAMVYVTTGTDAEMRAEVDYIADLIGSQIDAQRLAHGHYRTVRNFGPVQYGAIAVLADARARHEALHSYAGAVTPDTSQAGS
jgi:hypothetical protein